MRSKEKEEKNQIENQIEETVMEKKKKREDKLWSSTGCDLLDIMIGGGLGIGIPFSNIINIVGDKSSGKTFIACEIIAATRHLLKDKLKWVYDDCESGFTFDTKYLYGFEIMPVDIEDRTRSQTVEEWYCNYRKFADSLKRNEVGIYVTDSLDGLSSLEMKKRGDERYSAYKKGKDFDKGSFQMAKPKFLSQEFFPQIAEITERKNILLIVISQTRDKIDSFFKEQTRNGGKALDFYAHTALWLSVVRKNEAQGRVIGVTIKAHAKKSKTPRPYRKCDFNLIFDYGLDNIGTSVDFLFDLIGDDGKIKKAQAEKIIWKGEEITVKKIKQWMEEKGIYDEYKDWKADKDKKSGLDSMLEWIGNNEEYQKEIETKFGKMVSRNELISEIEKNDNMKVELRERVIAKWEAIEKEVRTDRPRKYQ